MLSNRPAVAAALLLTTALGWSSDALACGGCFAPPVQGNDGGTVVTAHRMALSLSPDQTILWDQIQYSGSPAEFAWVLPVKPGVRIEVASEAWFDVLDAATSTSISPPRLQCGGSNSCSTTPYVSAGTPFGCSGSAASDDGGTQTDPDPVQVVSHGATGPYESAIIHSDIPGALPAWLDSHGYAIPEGIAPVIDAYASEGFDFVALRLLPSSGIQQMRPVRVVQKGAVPVLPLRMVAAGTGAHTEITLFVISEGRYTTENFAEIDVPRAYVDWDFAAERSNYSELRDATIKYGGSLGVHAKGPGRSFFVPYAQRGALFGEVKDASTKLPARYQTTNGWSYTTLADAFVEQAFVNGETSSTDCRDEFDGLDEDTRKVVMPCAPDGTCAEVEPTFEIDGRSLVCDAPIGSDLALDDLAQALVGMHPRDVWITRLEGNLLHEALTTDLVLSAAKVQTPVAGHFTAATVSNLPPGCEQAHNAGMPGGGESDARRHIRRFAVPLVMTVLALLFMLRRFVPRRPLFAQPIAIPIRATRRGSR